MFALRHRALQCAATPASRAALFSTAEPLVLVEKVNNYAIVRLNRPPVNSLNTAVRLRAQRSALRLQL